MKQIFKKSLVSILALALILSSFSMLSIVASADGATPQAGVLVNGDFETGDLTGFTVDDFYYDHGYVKEGEAYKRNVAEIVDGFNGRSGKLLHVRCDNATGSVGAFGVYQSIAVKPNTDYVWTFYMYVANKLNHRIGVVAGNSFAWGHGGNTALPIEMTSETNMTITDTTTAGVYCSNSDTSPNTNWKEIGWVGKWEKYTVKFNSGNNGNVLLSYVPYASEREVYFDDWKLSAVGEITNGGFETGDLTGFTVDDFYYDNGYVKEGNPHKRNVAEIVDGFNRRNGKLLHVKHDNAAGSVGAFGVYQSVPVKQNTDYVWTFYMYVANKANHRIGVVAGNKFVYAAGGNTALPIEMTSATNMTITDTTTAGVYCSNSDWSANTNWKEIGWVGKWEQYTVRFNSGNNSNVLLSYVPYASEREVYFDNWVLSDMSSGSLQNGNFETAGTAFDPVPGFIFDPSDYTGATATINTTAGHYGKGLAIDSGSGYKTLHTLKLYQPVKVEKNTDYVWSLWLNPHKENQHELGVVAGAGVNDYGNVTLPVTYKVTQGEDIPAAQMYPNISADGANKKIDGTVDPNWINVNMKNGGYRKLEISFNSGDNDIISLAYVARASGRGIYFDDWMLAKAGEVSESAIPNGSFDYGTADFIMTNNTAFETVADPDNAGNNILHIAGVDGKNSFAYYNATVKPNTDYAWTFKVKEGDNPNNKKIKPLVQTTNWGFLPSTVTTNADNYEIIGTAGTQVALFNSANKWTDVTYYFNSGNNTNLYLMLWSDGPTHNVYSDDWDLQEIADANTNLTNNGFEDGLNGYKYMPQFSGSVTSAEPHTGNYSLETNCTGGWYDATASYIYQTVAVVPNSDYEWTFWYKNAAGTTSNARIAGVATGNLYAMNGGEINLLASSASGTGYIIAETRDFAEDRVATDFGTTSVWHAGFTSGAGWCKYTIKFNSGDNTSVSLIFDSIQGGDTRLGYMDDWNLAMVGKGAIINGDFENGLVSFDSEGGLTATVEDYNGSKAAKLTGGTVAFAPMFSQRIEVKPYTEYTWSFDLTTVAGGNAMFGVRNADNLSELVMSKMEITQGTNGVANKFFAATRDTATTNWHQANTSEANCKYVVTFYSGSCNYVSLTMNPVNNARTLYTDNWVLAETGINYGDADGNKVYGANDIAVLKKVILGTADDASFAGLDSNVDGAVNLLDLVNIKKSFTALSLTGLSDEQISLDGYRLVWSDDFAADSVNSDKWAFSNLMNNDKDLHLYSDERAVELKDGSILLKTNYEGNDFYSANSSLTTKGKMSFKYGYVEIRAKLPVGDASFPSFWMQSTNKATNVMGEIDIFEHFGNATPDNGVYIQTGIHKWLNESGTLYHAVNRGKGEIGRHYFVDVDDACDWHTYGMLWTPTTLTFFVDGVAYHSIDITEANDFFLNDYTGENSDKLKGMTAFNADYAYLIFNNYLNTPQLAAGDDSVIVASPESFSEGTQNYVIDYVRLYQPANGGIIFG